MAEGKTQSETGMLFCEPAFLFTFLPLLLILYAACPVGLRNLLLTVTSLGFYAWGERTFALVMLLSILMNYFVGLRLDQGRPQPARRRWLAAGVVGNLALLIAFKYAEFLTANLNAVLAAVGMPAFAIGRIHLPLGISFFTFQSMSYLVDVYRGEARSQGSFVNLALYVSLFPQLIAGPIVRYGSVAEALAHRRVSLQGFGYGAGRFILGLGKKMIIANTVAYPADRIFEIPHARLTFGLAWLGVVCYAMQIYFDFSGYSDMAVGLGRMFGFRFMENFNYPYASRSVTEFWRRWHISLSTWFRDYLYIPLGGNRVSQARTYLNLVIVFFLCGLWHGANWTFVAWGLFHGAFLVVERIGLRSRLDRLPAVLSRGYLLLVVLVSWVIFRSETLGDSVRYLAALFGLGARPADALGLGHFLTRELCLTLLIGAVGCAPVLPAMRGRLAVAIRGCDASARRLVCGLRYAGEAVFLAAVLLYSAMLMAADTYNPFIYFRF